MESLFKEIIEKIDPEGLFTKIIDIQSFVLLTPLPNNKIKIAFWDKNEQLVALECFGFVPIKMDHGLN